MDQEFKFTFPNDEELQSLLSEWNKVRVTEHLLNGDQCKSCQMERTIQASRLFDYIVAQAERDPSKIEILAITMFTIGQMYGRRNATEELTKIVAGQA
jgi:hypothetical protein